MIPQVLLLTILYALSCLAASYKEQTPPDYVIYSYPTNNVTVNDTILLGIDGGAIEVPHDYYGLVYDMSISLTYPNGTNASLVFIGSLVDPQGTHCRGKGSPPPEPGDLLSGAYVRVGEAGKYVVDSSLFEQKLSCLLRRYTAFWNVTYGSSTDPAIANQTSCDLSRLSYETWLFNASFNAVEPQGANGHFLPIYTTVTTDFPSQPTGKIFESNGAASSSGIGVGGVVGVLVLAFLQNL